MVGLLRKVAPGARIQDAETAASLGLVALFLFDEDSGKIRDLVSGTSTTLSSGSVSRSEAGRVLSFDGSQGTNMALRLKTNAGAGIFREHAALYTVAARFRPVAAASSDPAGIFGIYDSTGQGGFGVGWNTSTQVGMQWLSGNGAGSLSRSTGATGNWYTVFASIDPLFLGYAWINGQPATTSQGASLDGGSGGAHNEISVGAQHRSAGFLRQANGNLEWGAVLHGRPLNDRTAFDLYANDFPYNLLTPRRRYWFKPAAGGTDATAPGATVTATVSLVAGAATAASTAAGTTSTATASLIAGAASAASTAAGATLTTTASLIAGAATAASTAAGATTTATASLIAGAATAASTAAGATVTATASMVAGAATSGATAAGATVTATASLVAGAATAASTAAGATITTTASIIAGAATGTGDGAAAGATLTATASLVAGAATAASTAAGATTTATASLVAGAASAASTAAGATLTATASIIPGAASGAGNATASGATLQAIVSLIAGSPITASTAGGATVTATASLIPGTAFDSSAQVAPGATWTASLAFISGRPQVGAVNRSVILGLILDLEDETYGISYSTPPAATGRASPTPAIARAAAVAAANRTSATPVIPR